MTLRQGDKAGVVSVITLNVWGLQWVSKRRQERIHEIGAFIRKCGCSVDCMCFQEVWVSRDAQYLAQCGMASGFKHHVHFVSGLFGSGLLTISRFPIMEWGFTQYAAAGDALALHCGDYLAKKGVGWARLAVRPRCFIDVYNTHLHANYSHKAKVTKISGQWKVPNDVFAPFRVSQILQLAQVIRHTSKHGSVGAVLLGDFNTKPENLEYLFLRLLLPEFADAWAELNTDPLDPGHTCRAAGNTFESTRQVPERIDYVLTNLTPVCCEVTLKTCPKGFSYSDHFGVQAHLQLQPYIATSSAQENPGPRAGLPAGPLAPASIADGVGEGMLTSYVHQEYAGKPAQCVSGTHGLMPGQSEERAPACVSPRSQSAAAAGAQTLQQQIQSNAIVVKEVLQSCRRLLGVGVRRTKRQATQKLLVALLLALTSLYLSAQASLSKDPACMQARLLPQLLCRLVTTLAAPALAFLMALFLCMGCLADIPQSQALMQSSRMALLLADQVDSLTSSEDASVQDHRCAVN
ncbi:Endonuclease/exonuclease/phosphatase [Dunaliella salina]|uniref:Endonuclease/exonuclease/phosphatase n=1 Tax=Dunaliella salina TaxID=3046 RepID=A0ABQ7GCS9_DUNSA|nr:Endonuclease/exonuclease/phosphatase [Dunaliella salina]|eukprot:KAF5842564.1 Endonuclease/exonuclease/phosphatase [Dunaliella salina]